MANEVTITVTGRDAGAKQTITATVAETKKLGDSLQRIGEFAAGTLLSNVVQRGFQAFTSFLRQATAGAIEAGREQAQLAAVIRSTGGAAGFTADEINQLGLDLSKLTNFEDGAIVSSSSLLMTFTAIGRDVFPRAQKSILDVSTALGQDLQQSTIQIGKALNNPIEGLTNLARAGIQFTEQQKAQIRTMVEAGDLIGAQTVILGELETQFGGSAEAAVKADGGITQMNNSIIMMQDEIGTKLIPLLARWTELKLRLLDAFLALPGPMQVVVGVVAVLGAALLVLPPRIIAAKAAFDQMGLSMTALSAKARALTASLGPVGLVFAALTFAVVKGTQDFQAADVAADKLAEDLERLAKTGRETGVVAELMGRDLEHFGSVLEAVAANAESNWADRNFIWTPNKRKEVNQAVEDIGALDEALVQIVASGGDGEAALLAYADANGLTAEQVEQLRSFLPGYTEAQQRATEKTRDAASSARDQVVALEDLDDALKAQADPMFALIKAQQNLAEKQDAYTDAVRRFGRVSPQAEDALLALAEAGVDVASASARAGGAFDGRLTPAMRAALTAAGLTAEQIRLIEAAAERARQKLERFEGNYRANVHTTFTSSGRPPAGGARRNFAMAHGGIVGGIGAQAMQAGGISGSALGLVDEQGPELVRLPVGSTVIPSGQSQAILGGGGGGPVTLEVVAVGSGDDLMDAIVRRLSFRVRTQAAGSVDTLLGAR